MEILHEVTGEGIDRGAGTPGEVFAVFGRLGLTAFGGPIAHLAYFRAEFVERRGWLAERAYADLVALCQFLPGPTSSQVGFAIGLGRAGWAGALAAFVAFTLPSVLLLLLFAQSLATLTHPLALGALAGLKIAAVAVVAQAVHGMGRSLVTDGRRAGIMLGALALVTLLPGIFAQLAAIAAASLAGLLLVREDGPEAPRETLVAVGRRTGLAALALFVTLLFLLPMAAAIGGGSFWPLVDGVYRAGAFVFGGGHVVLPLLEAETVARGLVPPDTFLAGYGATQALPGPLFSFAAFLGAASGGLLLALAATIAIFLPGFLLLVAALPFAHALFAAPRAAGALAGANAAVVGLLLAALYDPIFTSAVHRPVEFLLAAAAFMALAFWRLPPLPVVAGLAASGAVLLS